MTLNISINSVLDALYLIAPQFITEDEEVIAMYESLATLIQCQINPRILSCCGVLVFAFLLAHYLSLQTNPNLGVNSGLKEGDLSINANVSADMNALLMTPYGRSYLDLIKRTVIGSTVTNLPPILGGVIQYVPGCCGSGYGYGSGGCC